MSQSRRDGPMAVPGAEAAAVSCLDPDCGAEQVLLALWVNCAPPAHSRTYFIHPPFHPSSPMSHGSFPKMLCSPAHSRRSRCPASCLHPIWGCPGSPPSPYSQLPSHEPANGSTVSSVAFLLRYANKNENHFVEQSSAGWGVDSSQPDRAARCN